MTRMVSALQMEPFGRPPLVHDIQEQSGHAWSSCAAEYADFETFRAELESEVLAMKGQLMEWSGLSQQGREPAPAGAFRVGHSGYAPLWFGMPDGPGAVVFFQLDLAQE